MLNSKTIGVIAVSSCQQTITEHENIQARSQRERDNVVI